MTTKGEECFDKLMAALMAWYADAEPIVIKCLDYVHDINTSAKRENNEIMRIEADTLELLAFAADDKLSDEEIENMCDALIERLQDHKHLVEELANKLSKGLDLATSES